MRTFPILAAAFFATAILFLAGLAQASETPEQSADKTAADTTDKPTAETKPATEPNLQEVPKVDKDATDKTGAETEPAAEPSLQEIQKAAEERLQVVQKALENAEFEKAAKLSTEILEREPRNAEALALRGRARNNLDQYDLARPDFEEALRLKPDCVEALHGMGCVFYEKQPKRAIKY